MKIQLLLFFYVCFGCSENLGNCNQRCCKICLCLPASMGACKKEHDCLPSRLQRCLAGGDLRPRLHLQGSCVAQAPDWGVSASLLRSVTATTGAGESCLCGKMLMTHFWEYYLASLRFTALSISGIDSGHASWRSLWGCRGWTLRWGMDEPVSLVWNKG